jgi:ABC-type nitrate/sulfonate/bicarbonate transport system permease component
MMDATRIDRVPVTRYRPLPAAVLSRAVVVGNGLRWLILLILLAAWETATAFGWLSRLFFSSPSVILQTLWSMTTDAGFAAQLSATLLRTAVGVALGAAAGLLSAWLIGAGRLIRMLAEPFIAALHPLPKLALFPILLVIFGIGETSKVLLIAITAFFPLLITTLAGISQIERSLWMMAANFGARGAALVRHLLIPASLPNALAGLKLALNSGLVVTTAIEMLSANRGLGTLIWLAWQTFRTEELYAVLIVIGAIGVAGNFLLDRAAQRLTPWLQRDGQVSSW